jgi:hypothetical protein
MDKQHREIRAEDEELENRSFLSQLLLWLRRGFLLLIGLFIFSFLFVQFPPVQTWLVKKIAKSLSDRLETTVSLEYISLTFFNELTLQQFYVEDYHRDTLLYSDRLRANFNLNPIAIIRRGLVVQEIGLDHARLHVQRREGELEDNLQQILNRLARRDTTKERKPFYIDLGAIALNDALFDQSDVVKGNHLRIAVKSGDIQVEKADFPNDSLIIKAVDLVEPNVLVEKFEEKPNPEAIPTAIEIMDSDTAAIADSSDFRLMIGEVHFTGGKFQLHNYRKSPVKNTPPEILDYNHLDVFDINIDIQDFFLEDWVFKGRVDKIAFRNSSGFVLEKLAAKEALVSPRRVELNGLDLITPVSHLGDTLIFKYGEYPDFEEFPDRVLMDIRLNNASVAISDIIVFAPGLEGNNFFHSNRSEVLRIDGRVSGRINNLRGRDLNIELADGSRIVGNFSSRNLAVRNQEILNLRLERFKTTMSTLRQIIPQFDPPSNFDKLGKIDFSGYFDGFFVDFVAYGDLRTNLGRAQMDMRMNLKEGREQASYSGNITLQDFDLRRWTGNPDFGKVTFNSKVINGSGLTGEKVNALLIANIEDFNFKGYNYENAYLEGELRWNHFDGNFSIADENIDFGFRGEINLSNGVPTYEFNASINKLDLKDLNLSDKDVILSGDVELDLRNRTLADLEGQARVTRFSVLYNQIDRYTIDSVTLSSRFVDTLGNRFFRIRSDILTADIDGRFDIQQVPEALIRYFHRNYPNFSDHLGIEPSDKEINPNQFSYQLEIKDSKGINRVVDEKLGLLQNIKLKGHYDSLRDSLVADLEIPRLSYGQLEFLDIVLLLDALGDQGDLDLGIDSTIINGKTGFSPIALVSILHRDSINFGVTYSSDNPFLENLYLDGELFVLDSNYMQVEFDRSKLVILQSLWDINAKNYIRFGNKTIETKNFNLTKDDKRITLESVGQKGLKLSLINLDFSYIDEVWDYEPLDFGGKYDIFALVRNVFQMKDISATAVSDTFLVNGDDWGRFRFDALAEDLEHPFNGYLEITKENSQFIAEGTFNPKTPPGEKMPVEEQANYFDFDLRISGYPAAISEYFIGETVSNTVGTFDADLHFFGLPPEPNVEGHILAKDGGVTINYLKTRYTFDVSNISVDNHLFDATGTILEDKYGHKATVHGGVRHNHLKDLGFSARLSTDRFLALDTKKGDNKMFYGQAIGEGEIWFSGSFKQPNIYVNATVGDSTLLTIPVNADAETSESSFVRFIDKNRPKETNELSDQELRGVSLEMDLSITEEAVVKIVFDEQAGDIIEGSGRGNIRIIVPRSSNNFQMYGEYVIERGDYLFTLYNVVNKNFRIRKGGTINWTGDPFGANIDLIAEYKGLNTSVANFIGEYLVSASSDLKNEASKSTDVNLEMRLRGELMQPIINFDISFPQLRGPLQNYTDSKLRLLKQDQNELNKQVFGLIVAGQFIPSNVNTFSGSEIIYNTVSEFVSNQLSLLLTELFSEFIEDGTVLSGIDFDIAYNQYQSVDLGEGQDISRGDELQVRLRQNFFNDRLSILVGGNIAIGSNIPTVPEATGTFVGNDLVIEYVLNKDRSLKLRVYQLLEPDIGGGRRLEVGTGLSYRKEFESFGAFLGSLKRSIMLKKKKETEASSVGQTKEIGNR